LTQGCIAIPVLLLICFASEEEAVQARLRYLDDVFKLQQILRGADRTGQPPSPDDQAWTKEFNSRRSAMYVDYKKANPPKDHWDIAPLPTSVPDCIRASKAASTPEASMRRPRLIPRPARASPRASCP
jgi:hypothetical protein